MDRLQFANNEIARLQSEYGAAYGIITGLEKENAELRLQLVCAKPLYSRRQLEAKLAAAEESCNRLRYRLKHIEAAVNYQSEDEKRDDAAKERPLPVEECGSILSPGDPSLCQFDPCKCLAIRGDDAIGEKG